MSASLVGSEMCIRDSRLRERAACLVRCCRAWPPGRPDRAVGKKPRAVSYTHLTLPTICSV
eukprot:12328234-Alexandrium_andersonii.AAC.1